MIGERTIQRSDSCVGGGGCGLFWPFVAPPRPPPHSHPDHHLGGSRRSQRSQRELARGFAKQARPRPRQRTSRRRHQRAPTGLAHAGPILLNGVRMAAVDDRNPRPALRLARRVEPGLAPIECGDLLANLRRPRGRDAGITSHTRSHGRGARSADADRRESRTLSNRLSRRSAPLSRPAASRASRRTVGSRALTRRS